jgi:hypothetical protein
VDLADAPNADIKVLVGIAACFTKAASVRSPLAHGGWDVEMGQDNNQTCSWDGSNWVQLTPKKSPVAREGLGMAHDPATHESTMFGGQIVSTGRELRDTWKWNGK